MNDFGVQFQIMAGEAECLKYLSDPEKYMCDLRTPKFACPIHALMHTARR